MSDSSTRLSGINVVSWIVGSGLIVFGINTIYNDYLKQPHINIDMFGYSNPNNTVVNSTVRITNNGMASAKNLTLSLTSPDVPILNATVINYDEQSKKITLMLESPHKLIATIPRLVYSGHGVSFNVSFNLSNAELGTPESSSAKAFYIPSFGSNVHLLVASDQGGTSSDYTISSATGSSYISPNLNTLSTWQNTFFPVLILFIIPSLIYT